MSSVGPLSLHFWNDLSNENPPKRDLNIRNPPKLISSVLIASQRHQLRPLISRYLGQQTWFSCSTDDLFQGVSEALSQMDGGELLLDTSNLLIKLMSKVRIDCLAKESICLRVRQASNESKSQLTAFTNILVACHSLLNQRSYLNLENFLETQCLSHLKNILVSEEHHDEVRIVAFHMLLVIVLICNDTSKSGHVENSHSKEIARHLIQFYINDAVPSLCLLSSTPSRERFCSLVTSYSTELNDPEVADKIVSKLVEIPFDDSTYSVQRVMLRLFCDLLPKLSPNQSLMVYSKLLHLCQSDFNDIRRQASKTLINFYRLSFCFIADSIVDIAERELHQVVRIINEASNSNDRVSDNFMPSQMAYFFYHCALAIFKNSRGQMGQVTFSYNVCKSILCVKFESINIEENSAINLGHLAQTIRSVLENYEDSKAVVLIFLLSLGHASPNSGCEALVATCEQGFWLFFGDDSPFSTFSDRSLGGYSTGRENPAWSILQWIAKILSNYISLTANEEWKPKVCEMVKRVLFSTLHFGLLEEYSGLLCSAIVAWPQTVASEFENILCDMVWSQDEVPGEEIGLSPSEVRRGGGLSLAFTALCNALTRLERSNDIERILRSRLLDPDRWSSAQAATQAAIFHVIRAAFAFAGVRGRTNLSDVVADRALQSLCMQAPFQARNAAVQALSTCVRPIVAEGISSIWKFARMFPATWQSVRKTIRMWKEFNEELMLTASLSILASMNPLISPMNADENWHLVLDDLLEEDLFEISISSKIAYVRQAAATALVAVACSDPNSENPVLRASKLLNFIVCSANRYIEEASYIQGNVIHGYLLIFDRLVYVMLSSWGRSRIPLTFARSGPSVLLAVRLLKQNTPTNAQFLQEFSSELISKLVACLRS